MNTEFNFQGINHLAFVCRDMAETIEFWEGKLDNLEVYLEKLKKERYGKQKK